MRAASERPELQCLESFHSPLAEGPRFIPPGGREQSGRFWSSTLHFYAISFLDLGQYLRKKGEWHLQTSLGFFLPFLCGDVSIMAPKITEFEL